MGADTIQQRPNSYRENRRKSGTLVCTPWTDGLELPLEYTHGGLRRAVLTEAKIKTLQPRDVRYLVSDGRGLNIEVLPSGKRSWIFRYRFRGAPEKVMIGRYPEMSLKRAREERDKRAGVLTQDKSPAQMKRLSKQQFTAEMTLKDFGERYFSEVTAKRWKDPGNIRRWLDNDIYPWLGSKALKEITPADVQRVVFRKRDHGAPASAAKIRGLLKEIFEYAAARQLIGSNPVASLPLRFITTARARTRALSAAEVGIYLRELYRSNVRRQFKLALNLILLTLVRKGELLLARWDELDPDAGEWNIPGKRTKNGKPHIVYLSRQAAVLFEELRGLASGSDFVLPGRSSLKKPFSLSALNHALEGVNFGLAPFTIHDMRRTASTILHEKGFPSDVIEKALNHTIGGVRGVYNRAEYADQRREMLQFWADHVEKLATEDSVIAELLKR
jgi:integrase